MTAVVAAEAAGPVQVSHVVRMGLPVHPLFWEEVPLVDVLQDLDGLPDFLPEGPVGRGILFGIPLLQALYRLQGFLRARVWGAQEGHGLFADVRDVRRDEAPLQGVVYGLLRGQQGVTRPVVTVHTIHEPEVLRTGKVFRGLKVHIRVFGHVPLGVGQLRAVVLQ
jgi:hypothetical protein